MKKTIAIAAILIGGTSVLSACDKVKKYEQPQGGEVEPTVVTPAPSAPPVVVTPPAAGDTTVVVPPADPASAPK